MNRDRPTLPHASCRSSSSSSSSVPCAACSRGARRVPRRRRARARRELRGATTTRLGLDSRAIVLGWSRLRGQPPPILILRVASGPEPCTAEPRTRARATAAVEEHVQRGRREAAQKERQRQSLLLLLLVGGRDGPGAQGAEKMRSGKGLHCTQRELRSVAAGGQASLGEPLQPRRADALGELASASSKIFSTSRWWKPEICMQNLNLLASY